MYPHKVSEVNVSSALDQSSNWMMLFGRSITVSVKILRLLALFNTLSFKLLFVAQSPYIPTLRMHTIVNLV